MIKRNNLRKIYMAYVIAVGELFAAAILICAGYLLSGAALDVVRILVIAAMVCIPVIMYIFYRLRGRDNAASSDELEQIVITKAFALAGFVAITLLPLLLVLVCFFSAAAGYAVFGYTAVVGGTMKLGMLYYNRKF